MLAAVFFTTCQTVFSEMPRPQSLSALQTHRRSDLSCCIAMARPLECSATATQSRQLRPAPGYRHLDGHIRNRSYLDWLDRPSSQTDVDVLLQRASSAQLQNTQFGFANFTGLGAALLFLMLLAISNDLSLRTLKGRRWKSMQRWTYVAFLLTGVTWHCASIDREAPCPLGSRLCGGINSSCCCSIPWLCPDSLAVACSHTLRRAPYHRRTECSIMTPSIRNLLLTAHITLSVGWFVGVARTSDVSNA